MFGADLQVGDKIMFVGNEEVEYFTFGNIYEIKSLEQYKNWFNENIFNIIVIDDFKEEYCLTLNFYKRNFKKVIVTITVYDDNTFTTETEFETLNWNNDMYTLETLISLLTNLGIGFEIRDFSTETNGR